MSRNAQKPARTTPLKQAFGLATLLAAFGGWIISQPNGALASELSLGLGTNVAHVFVARDAQATEAFRPKPERVNVMVTRGILAVTGKKTIADAWLSLVSKTDVVGLKVYSLPGPNSGTRVAVVAAIIEGLLQAGLPATNIVVWDRQAVDLRLAGFYELADKYGVRVAGAVQVGFDNDHAYEDPFLGNLVWGDLQFGLKAESVGRKSFITKLVTKDLTRIINITPLLNHNLVGVSGNLYSLAMGSTDNTLRFETDKERLAKAVPEIYAREELSDKVVLNIVDALVCQYEGGERGLLHYAATLNELWFSKDPVALDALSIKELQRIRDRDGHSRPSIKTDLYAFAELLDLGVADPKRISVETLRGE